MPLNKGALAAQLKDLFQGTPTYPADVSEAGRRWASIYRSYAAQAAAGPTAPIAALVSAAEPLLAAALANGFTVGAASGGVGGLSSAMGNAFAAFWLSIKFAPRPPAPPTIAGVVSQALPGTLAALLAAAFAQGLQGATAESQADAIATSLDGWSRTVTVINTPVTPPGPPAPPVPLT